MKPTSKHLKASVMNYYRFKYQHIVASEVSSFVDNRIADILTIDKDNVVTEIEVKISKADLLNEVKVKALKHKLIEETNKGCNKFYFCVAEELLEDCEIFVKKNYPNYGILLYEYVSSSKSCNNISVYRKAKKLDKKRTDKQLYWIKKAITDRATSELCNLCNKVFDKNNK